MSSRYTPLRYPGGKSIMADLLEGVFTSNHIFDTVLAEPYAGGAGASLKLLLTHRVSKILINDASLPIYAFWNNLINNGDNFIREIEETPVNLSVWKDCHKLLRTETRATSDLAFAVFFLSRTNRSGILTAGPIGGITEAQQNNAKYKIDCRFNKKTLISQLQAILSRADSIRVSNLDALDFLCDISPSTFVYLDPPYYKKGRSLYLDYYRREDHVKLSEFLKHKASFKWILSYDNVPEIRELYKGFPLYGFNLPYSAHIKRKGEELLTHSENILFSESNSTKNLSLYRIESHEN